MSSPPPGRCDVEEYLARDLSRACFQRKIRFQRITHAFAIARAWQARA